MPIEASPAVVKTRGALPGMLRAAFALDAKFSASGALLFGLVHAAIAPLTCKIDSDMLAEWFRETTDVARC